MSSRDEFSKQTKQLLSSRVAHRCSNPDCRAATIGPQSLSDGSINLGVAAHITAAAVGGPRYDSSLTSDERSGAGNGIWLCQNCAKLVDSDIQRFTVRLLNNWKKQAEMFASKEMGQVVKDSPILRKTDRAEEIRQNLKLRDTLKKALLKPPAQINFGEVNHPYEKFQYSRIIVRSLDDSDYPKVCDSSGISSWFRVELYDFYHNGIKVILGVDYAIINNKGEWRPIDYYESFDDCLFNRIKVWILGYIPYRFINAYDLEGDEYYNEPHFYCAFANNGEPFEAIHYRTVGGEGGYDFPLDEERRLPAPPDT
jgi:hypothetical protein